MPILADRCPLCGGDPDVRLIELGSSSKRPVSSGTGPGRPGLGARRWAPIAAGLLGMWALLAITAGGDGNDSDAADDPAETTTTERRERTTPTTRKARPFTTTIPEVVADAPLLGEQTGLAVVLVGDETRIVHLDTGVVERIRQQQVFGTTERGLLVGTNDGLQIWPQPYDGSSPVQLTPTYAEQAWVVGGGTRVWVARPDFDNGYVASLIDLDGTVLLELPVPVQAWPAGAVDRGLVLAAPGGTYLLDGQGAVHRLSTGQAMASSANRVFVMNCDAELTCSIEVLDGRGLLVDRIEQHQAIEFRFPNYVAAPDGRFAYVVGEGAAASISIDGTVVASAGFSEPTAMGWSPDGRWLAFASGGDLRFIDTVNGGEPIVVELDVGRPPAWQLFLVSTT